MNKKVLFSIAGAMLVVIAIPVFFVHIYTSSPGYTTTEAAELFFKNSPKCHGLNYVLNANAIAADAPGKSLCIGILITPNQTIDTEMPNTPSVMESHDFDAKNGTYIINGEAVTLVNGISEKPAAPGSASKIITRYFGNEAKGYLDEDGRIDTAFLISQETGGTGLFYYAVVALNQNEGYKVTNSFLIGDRIAPQSTNIIAKEIHINYADRKPGEPMSTPPSVGSVKLLKVHSNGILEGLMK